MNDEVLNAENVEEVISDEYDSDVEEIAELIAAEEERALSDKKKKNILTVTNSNDMSYRGPLSYRSMKVLAWLCFVCMHIVTVKTFKEHMLHKEDQSVWYAVVKLLSPFGLSLMLVANFAIILNGHEKYLKQIIRNALAAICFAVCGYYVYWRYIIGLLTAFTGDETAVKPTLYKLFSSFKIWNGYISYNVFLDLFLCTLTMYFINYNPKKHFQGKRIYIFRSMTLLPIAYEIACIVIKIMASSGEVTIPVELYPWLTTKPPLTFLILLAMALYVHKREKHYLEAGKTVKDYRAFLKTKTNSWQFSKHLCGIILKVALLDVLVYFLLSVFYYVYLKVDVEKAAEAVSKMGFGDTMTLIMLVPVILLFSYTRDHKDKKADIIIPVIGVCTIGWVYIEAAYKILMIVFKKLNA